MCTQTPYARRHIVLHYLHTRLHTLEQRCRILQRRPNCNCCPLIYVAHIIFIFAEIAAVTRCANKHTTYAHTHARTNKHACTPIMYMLLVPCLVNRASGCVADDNLCEITDSITYLNIRFALNAGEACNSYCLIDGAMCDVFISGHIHILFVCCVCVSVCARALACVFYEPWRTPTETANSAILYVICKSSCSLHSLLLPTRRSRLLAL